MSLMDKEIPLTQGKVAIVDEADFGYLSQFKWCASKGKTTYYAMRSLVHNGKNTTIYMHRAIMNPPFDLQVDHRNMDGLDNRRANLRICTNSQNHMNAKKRGGHSSSYKGVSWRKARRKWRARIMVNKTEEVLGSFDDEREAANAYNARAKELFGEFAKLNIVEEQR